MKKLEELGISPAPWMVASNNFGVGENIIWDSNGRCVRHSEPEGSEEANARLIAAAPDLYEALRIMVNLYEERATYADEQDAIAAAKAALAKAAGEDRGKNAAEQDGRGKRDGRGDE